VWNGSATESYYYFDRDGDGDGSTPYGYICSTDLVSEQALFTHTLVTNQDDTDDTCASEIYDECGVCDGENTVVNCGDVGVWNATQCTVMDCGGECNGFAYFQTVYEIRMVMALVILL
jgi:hypothetical protein